MKAFRLSLAVLALSGLVALPAWAEESVTAWRLFVADHEQPLVTALDLADGSVLGTFPLGSPARLYATPSGAGVYAVQGAANQVSVIGTGLKFDDHGDHGDLHVAAPGPVGAALLGDKPVHFVPHDGRIAVFFDGEGKARLLNEADWLDGKVESQEITLAAPHHGVAIPFGAQTLVSVPDPANADNLPIGMEWRGADGAIIGDMAACPDLHGEATSGDVTAIACATGLLLVEPGADGPVIRHLPYDPALPAGKTTTLVGGVGLQYFLGNYGADKVALIDPAAETPFRLVDLPMRRVHFAVDPVRVKYAYVFTEDGALQRINVLSGVIDKTLQLTEPYSMDGEWSLPRPRIAVAGDRIVVTDPLKSVLHVINAEHFALDRDIPLAGKPYNIVAVGGSGAAH
jgi:hypothetical protein